MKIFIDSMKRRRDCVDKDASTDNEDDDENSRG